jgi:transposase
MADLDAIEKDWKADNLTNVAIGARHGVSEGYVRKVAKKFAWTRGAAVTPPKAPPPPRELMRRDAPETAGLDDPTLANNLLRRMLDELDTVTSHIGELEELIELETHDDRDDRRRAAMMKAVSLPVRANTLKLLLMAQADAAPEGKKGKKELLQEAAVVAGKGKFKSSAPPLQVVGGK